ncbi:MAG: TetR/AcrR family transcriptional regulator [Clostridium sp.]|uniref:TetR/AcrR family transcriptional regulator n=1 Tax=Clostridium sp. TaxID=1506 RepID=UPI00290D216C|nr:TetR/AcrR family transcriptional regulator [Clostridium sp.]MDU5109447.1 TetR/AcrR family transcriptional regulator [Clostridium sp.]
MATPLNSNIKEKIIENTILLLHSTSFDDITLAKISKESNISKGTLYYYYNNKEDILFDIIDRYISKLADDLIVWVENKEKDTSAPRLFKYVLERGAEKEYGNLRLYLIGACVSENISLREKYVERYLYFKRSLTKKINERLPNSDGEYLAWLLLTTMDGILIQNQLNTPEFNSDDFIKKTILFMLK